MTSCVNQPIPDITGVGVRVSLYTLSLGAPLICSLYSSRALRESVETSLGITGLALLLTAFVFTAQHKLDLLHTLCLFHLISLVGLTIRPSNVEFRNGFHRSLVYGFFYSAFLAFLVFVVYVFAVAPHFGTNPECNSMIRFVIFGIDVPVVNFVFRRLFIVSIAVFLFLRCIMIMMVVSGQSGSEEESEPEPGEVINQGLSESAGRIYLILTIELFLKRNTISPGEGEWGFGQILSMMMLVGPVFQFIMELGEETESNFEEVFEGLLAVVATRSVGIALILIDFAANAAAGAAAAATGAHVNGSEVTTQIVRLGALAGVIATGIINFCSFVSDFTEHTMLSMLTVGMSTFGVAFLVVLAIGQRVLGEVPDAMLIGSLAAAAPLMAGSSLRRAAFPKLSILPGPALWDALGAYTFARVSENHGYHICGDRVAVAAGAVFGIVMWAFRLPYVIMMPEQSSIL